MKKRVLSFLLVFLLIFQVAQPALATEEKEVVTEETNVADKEIETATKEAEVADKEADVATEGTEEANKEADVATEGTEEANKEADVATEETDASNKESDVATEETEEANKEADVVKEDNVSTEKADTTTKEAQEATQKADTTTKKADVNTEEKNLTILHVNDTHGRYNYEEGKVIGYPKAKTIIDQFKAQGPTIALDAGDATHGTNFATLSQGESIVKLLDMAGFSAIVPGNHDFNYGKDRLIELSSMGQNLKYMSANIKVEDTGENLLQANDVYDVDGIKVGVFGISTPETVYKSHPNNTKGLNFDDVVNSAKASINDLKAKGAEVIILLSHLGTDEASEVNTFTLLDQLDNKDAIDVVLDGHSHSLYENGFDYNGTFIASTGYHFQNIGVTTIKIGAEKKSYSSRMINVADEEVINAEENPEILSLIQQYEGANDEVLSKVIGNTATELDGARPNVRTKETNLADLITDSMRLATGADAVITNGGGIRASIDAGEITMAEALEVLPFGNLVTVIEATGQDIVDALKHGASDYPEPKGAFPQVSGLEYTIDISSGSVEIKDVKINGEDIQLEKTYTLATNDFMAVGGDDYKMFEGSKQVSLHGSMLEIFANYLTELSKDGAFTATTDGRIKVVTEIEEPEDTQEPGDTEKPKDKDKPADTKKPAEDNTKTQKNTNVNTSRNTNNNKARKNSPNTGDKSLVIPVVVLAIALGGLVVINNKKEKVR